MRPVTRHALGTTALLCSVLLVAGCGKNHAGSAAGQGSASPSGPAAPTTPTALSPPARASASTGAAAAGCASPGLTAKVDTAQGGAAAGSTYVPIDFTNTSGSSCTLYGYPGVSFVTRPAGSQLGQAARRNPGATATMVTLAPGAMAHATLQVAAAGNYSPHACTPVTAHWLKIFPPNQPTAIYARYTVQACSVKLRHGLGSQLAVYVVRPGPGKAGQGP
jgi:hypothetical protein